MSDRQIALLDNEDSPIIGPKTAEALRGFVIIAQAEIAGLEKPTLERVEAMIVRLSIGTAKRRMSGPEAREAVELYWRVLRDVPLVDLARAFDEILRTSTFMPKPAELYAVANRFTAMRSYRLSRARHLVWKHEQEWRPLVVDPVTPAELDEIKRKAADSLTTRCQED